MSDDMVVIVSTTMLRAVHIHPFGEYSAPRTIPPDPEVGRGTMFQGLNKGIELLLDFFGYVLRHLDIKMSEDAC